MIIIYNGVERELTEEELVLFSAFKQKWHDLMTVSQPDDQIIANVKQMWEGMGLGFMLVEIMLKNILMKISNCTTNLA